MKRVLLSVLLLFTLVACTEETCDEWCQLEREEDRLHCIYTADDPNNC